MAARKGLSKEARRGLLLISPPLIYAIALLAVPLAAVILFSFWSQDFLDIDRTLTLNNYREFLALGEVGQIKTEMRAAASAALDSGELGLFGALKARIVWLVAPVLAFFKPLYMSLLMRSLAVALLVTVATVVLAYPMAYFISFKVKPRHKSLWLFLITIPFWTSYLIRVSLWKVILGEGGVLNILYSIQAVVLTLAHAFAPFAILPIFVVLERIDRSLLEASQDLGENKLTTFLRVTLPLSVPGIVAASLIVFIPTIGDYVTPALVGGPEGRMIANFIQVLFFRLNDAPMGAAVALVAMASVTLISLIFIRLNRRWLRGGGR